jgi:hypothetical protein
MRNSMVYPTLGAQDNFSMVFVRNLSDPTQQGPEGNNQTTLSCSMSLQYFIVFNDTKAVALLNKFIDAMALCLPRSILVINASVTFKLTSPSAPPPPAHAETLTSLTIRYQRAENGSAPQLAKVAAVDPLKPVESFAYSREWCNLASGEYCFVDSIYGTPFYVTASDGILAVEETGGYNPAVAKNIVCNFTASPIVVLPWTMDGFNVFPTSAVISVVSPCLPSTGGGSYTGLELDMGRGELSFLQSGSATTAFTQTICNLITPPAQCPYLPNFRAPESIADAEAMQTCIEGVCYDSKTIEWAPCGPSLWNFEGFHALGACHSLNTILRGTLQPATPGAAVVEPCEYNESPASCRQLAGRYTSHAVDLILQGFQPQLRNISSQENTSVWQDNCVEGTVPSCVGPNNYTIVPGIPDLLVLCAMLEYLSQPLDQIYIAGYCSGEGGRSSGVTLTSCGIGPANIQIPILQINSSQCLRGITAHCSSCTPYIEPGATTMPYTFMVLSSLKDIALILLGAYFLSKQWFRRPIMSFLTSMLLSITPMNAREKKKYREVILSRFNPVITAPGVLYDICDELLIKDDTTRKQYLERRESQSSRSSSRRTFGKDLTLDNFLVTIGLRRPAAQSGAVNIQSGDLESHVTTKSTSSPKVSKTSVLSEPLLQEGSIPSFRKNPNEGSVMESDLFDESSGILVEGVDSEVLQSFYSYYREAICEHCRRQISNTGSAEVRRRFQRVFEVYTEIFTTKSGRERLISQMMLDIDDDDLDIPESQNIFQSIAVTSRQSSTRRFEPMLLPRSRSSSKHWKASLVGSRTGGRTRLSSCSRDYESDPFPGSVAQTEEGNELLGDPLMALPEAERQVILAKEEELAMATEELLDVCEMVPIILVPTMVDARFTPQAWMLVLEAAYCVMYFFVCVYESASVPGYGRWDMYQAVYFRYINSAIAVDLVVNAFLRRIYLDEPLVSQDPYLITGLLLIGPSLVTHILPGVVLYAWIITILLAVWVPLCWIMRQLEKHFFYTMDPVSILFRVVFRLGTTLVATLLLQSSFNWSLLFYDKRGALGYLGVVAFEYQSRTWGCLIESRLASLANVVQFLSAFV